jgi:hypothetical protein
MEMFIEIVHRFADVCSRDAPLEGLSLETLLIVVLVTIIIIIIIIP